MLWIAQFQHAGQSVPKETLQPPHQRLLAVHIQEDTKSEHSDRHQASGALAERDAFGGRFISAWPFLQGRDLLD